jgi:hypothetical protein
VDLESVCGGVALHKRIRLKKKQNSSDSVEESSKFEWVVSGDSVLQTDGAVECSYVCSSGETVRDVSLLETGVRSTPHPSSSSLASARAMANRLIVSASSSLYTESFAIVVGINKYSPRRNGLGELKYSVNDAESVARLLRGKFNFRCTVLTDEKATRKEILRSFRQIREEMTAGSMSRLIFFFSGHGSGEDDGYIFPIDCHESKKYTQAISMTDLQRAAGLSKARHQLFVLDSCFSGSCLKPSHWAKRAAKVEEEKNDNETSSKEAADSSLMLQLSVSERSVQGLAAASENETARALPLVDREGFHNKNHGVMTSYLLEALDMNDRQLHCNRIEMHSVSRSSENKSTGKTETHWTRFVTASEIGRFVQRRVQENGQTDQHAQFGWIEAPRMEEKHDRAEMLFEVEQQKLR